MRFEWLARLWTFRYIRSSSETYRHTYRNTPPIPKGFSVPDSGNTTGCVGICPNISSINVVSYKNVGIADAIA
jgi:hypothetical protein